MFVKLLVVTLVVGTIATIAVLLSVKVLKSRATRSLSKDSETIKNQIKAIDEAIVSALDGMAGMVSIDEVAAVQSGRDKLLSELEVEKQKLAAKEKQLERAQGEVDQAEARHGELKRGKEGSEAMAQQIQEDRAKLNAESARLGAELAQAKQMLEAFHKEHAKQVDPDQKTYLDETLRTIDKMAAQLHDLVELHELATQRFVGLQKQYTELEKEYRRLVDREISGNF